MRIQKEAAKKRERLEKSEPFEAALDGKKGNPKDNEEAANPCRKRKSESPKEGEEEDEAKEGRKAKQSRKSAAYHAAYKKFQSQGEVARKRAKEVSQLNLFVLFTAT